MFRYIILIFTVMILTYGCISEFDPRGNSETSEILVVEGFVTDYQTVIDLSKSVGLSEVFELGYRISDASVSVERDDGVSFNDVLTESAGNYVVTTEKLDPAKKYRLKVVYDGEEYVSEFLSPVPTPEIEEVALTKGGPGESVRLRVSTSGTADGSKYYSWRIEERWEFHTELFANFQEVWYPSGPVYRPYNITTSNNTYYCWGLNYIGRPMTSTVRNEQNVLFNYPVYEIESSDKRLQLLYYVNISQNCVRKETYDYFDNIQKNSQQTGGLFSPVPSELNGNITCTTSPDKPVIGYVEVSSTSRLEKFFDEVREFYEPQEEFCRQQIVTTRWEPLVREGYTLYEYTKIELVPPGPPSGGECKCVTCTCEECEECGECEECPECRESVLDKRRSFGADDVLDIIFKYAPTKCVDCRAWPDASKRKPEWWPTDNL